MSTDCMVECRNVTKRYGSTVALSRFSLDVRSGQVLALLGENGAGKTTLMRLILGLHWPDDGEVLVFGENLTSDREGLLARIGSLRARQCKPAPGGRLLPGNEATSGHRHGPARQSRANHPR